MNTALAAHAAAKNVASGIKVLPLAGRIGAEICDVNLADITDTAFSEIREALLRHRVLFIRNQENLSIEGHERFAGMFGTPEAHPTIPPVANSRFVLELDGAKGGRANNWHTDTTFTEAPCKVSVLRAIIVPKIGGDTVFANTVAAYADLPENLRHMADNLWARHSNAYDYAARSPKKTHKDADLATKMLQATLLHAEHPLVHIHPETGERALVLGAFFQRFVGFSQQDSHYLYDLFQRHITRLENTVRWRWLPGDVVVWDNFATQHYAIDDYGNQERYMQRVSVRGDAILHNWSEKSRSSVEQQLNRITAQLTLGEKGGKDSVDHRHHWRRWFCHRRDTDCGGMDCNRYGTHARTNRGGTKRGAGY